MGNFTASDVKELREITNIGMMDCKKALTDADGDKEKALKILKEKGLAVAEKRAGRDAKEGVIKINTAGNKGSMIKLSCETDFVAKGDAFLKLADDISSAYDAQGDAYAESEECKNAMLDVSGKTGEKIELKEYKTIESSDGFVASYLHSNSKVGVLLEVKGSADAAGKDEVKDFAKDICMQIAAMDPIAITTDQISDQVKADQKEVFLKQMESEDKPDNIKEKIVEGKLKKYFSEKCLMEMVFVKDSKLKVNELQKNVSKIAGEDLSITSFCRMQIGS